VQGKYNIKTVTKSIHVHDIFQLKMTQLYTCTQESSNYTLELHEVLRVLLRQHFIYVLIGLVIKGLIKLYQERKPVRPTVHWQNALAQK
jgi:hypothetical protein